MANIKFCIIAMIANRFESHLCASASPRLNEGSYIHTDMCIIMSP